MKVTNLDVTYDKTTRKLLFDVAGESDVEQKVRGKLIVSAYGQEIYTKTFNPCDSTNPMPGMCPGKSTCIASVRSIH